MQKKIKLLTAVFLSLLCFSACGAAEKNASHLQSDSQATTAPEKNSGKDNDAQNTITVGLTYIPNIQFAPLYIAAEKGYFKDAGLNVRLRHHGAQESLLGALQAGEEDIVFAGGDEMMQGRSTGVDVVNWATMYQNYPVVLIAPKASGISQWTDLVGKKIGLPGPYGENYYGLLAALEIYGIQGKVEIEYIGYTQAAALQTKKVDAIIGFQNNDTIALQNAGIAVVNLPIHDGAQPPLVGVGFGSLSQNIKPQLYQKFLSAVERAVKDAAADLAAAVELTKKYVPSLAEKKAAATAKAVLNETLKLYQGAQRFGEQNPQTWQAMQEFLSANKILEKEVQAKDAFTMAVLDAK